jgi:hypothetical protein
VEIPLAALVKAPCLWIGTYPGSRNSMRMLGPRLRIQDVARVRKVRSTGSAEVYQGAGLKAALATPASCTRSAGKSSASPRRNVPSRSGRGTRACSIFGEGCVWICGSCFGSASSSVFTCGKQGRYAEHDQSFSPPRFFSHKETIHAQVGDVNRDMSDQPWSLRRLLIRCQRGRYQFGLFWLARLA